MGMRAIFVKDGEKAFIWTEGGEEVSDVLPSFRKDLLSLNAKTVYLDAEIVPYTEDFESLGRSAAVAAMGKKEVDDRFWVAHVFDILYLNGEQLWNKPYEERRKTLRGIELPRIDYPKSFKFHLQENIPREGTSVEESLGHVKEVSKVKFSEGGMMKLSDSISPLGRRTPEWAKIKISADVDSLIVAKFPKTYRTGAKKGQPIPGQFILAGAVGPVKDLPAGTEVFEPKDLTHDGVKARKQKFVKHKGKTYSLLGLTFATAEPIEIGEIVRVSVRLIRKYTENEYRWLIPKVLERRPEKTEPDPLTVVSAIAKKTKFAVKKETGMSEKILESFEVLEEYLEFVDLKEEEVLRNLDFEL